MLQLGRFPRVRLGHLPTPLEPMARLSAHLGGPKFWIKRDDCTGLATGGNKTRKLEYLVADALQQGADTLITLGALQSNHARPTAAAAARLGLKCVLVLEERVSQPTDAYRHNGNVLLDPVYSGKAMAGLIGLVRKGTFAKDEHVVFVHTGGQAGLFAYQPAFAA